MQVTLDGQGFDHAYDSLKDSPPFFATSSKHRRELGESRWRVVAPGSRKGKETLTLIPCAIVHTPYLHRLALAGHPPTSTLIRWHKGCRTSRFAAKRPAAQISTKIYRRRGANEDPNHSHGSSSSSPYSSLSESSALPPTSMLPGSASQCSLANRRQWEIARSGASRFSGEWAKGRSADSLPSHYSCVLGCLWSLFNNDVMGLCQSMHPASRF